MMHKVYFLLWLLIVAYLLQSIFYRYCYNKHKGIWLLGFFSPGLVLINTVFFLLTALIWHNSNSFSFNSGFISQVTGVTLVISFMSCITILMSDYQDHKHYYNIRRFGGSVDIYRGSLFAGLKCLREGHLWRSEYISYRGGNDTIRYSCFNCEKQIDTDRRARENVVRYFNIDE